MSKAELLVDFHFGSGRYAGPAEMVEDRGTRGAIVRYPWKGMKTTIWLSNSEIVSGLVEPKAIQRKPNDAALDAGPKLPPNTECKRCPLCGK